MKIRLAILLCAWLTGCGGGTKPAPAPPAPVAKPEPEKPPELPPAPPEPALPKHLGAKAALTAVKGAKLDPGTVTFSQDEGSDTKVVSEFSGLKAGSYQLVIHEGSECGADAAKAGPPWKGGEGVKLAFKVGKGQPGNIDQEVKLMLGGVAPIVGQTLMLHEDKKGQPGKPLACGTIDSTTNQ